MNYCAYLGAIAYEAAVIILVVPHTTIEGHISDAVKMCVGPTVAFRIPNPRQKILPPTAKSDVLDGREWTDSNAPPC